MSRKRAGAPRSVAKRSIPVPAAHRRPWARLAPFALTAAVACGVYANTLRAGLVYDDRPDIVQNRYVRQLDLVRIFTEPSWATWVGVGYAGYRPVTTATFAANHALHGLAPFGYHAVNVALHAAVSVLLVLIVARLTGRPRVGLLTGLFFAAHPVHSEAVASVIGRAEPLAALFALGAWWAFLAGAGAGAARRSLWLGLAALLIGVGTLAKESAATVALAIVAVDALLARERPRLPAYAALLAAAGAALAVRSLVAGGLASNIITEMDNPLVGKAIAVRAWTTLAVVAHYARLLAWPVHLSADYSYRQIDAATSPFAPAVLAGLAIVASVLAAAGWARRHAPDVCVGLVLLAVTASLALAATFFAAGPVMGERLMYVPSAGFCLVVAAGLDRVWERRRRAAVVGVAALVVAYGARTWTRNAVWQDQRTFAEAMVRDAPKSARSHRELGLVYGESGEHEKAVAELIAARRIVAHPALAYDLGHVLLGAGRPAEAARAYEEAIAMKPDFVEAMTNLANAHSDQGDEASAESWLRRALAIDPALVDARLNLANSLLRRGRLTEAEAEYRDVIRRAPRDALARVNYGICLEALARPADAAEQYRATIGIDPSLALAHARLVAALMTAGRRDEARAAQANAERLFPADPAVRQSRGFLAGG